MGEPVRAPAATAEEPLPIAAQIGVVVLCAALAAAPWPYGCVVDPWRFALIAVTLLGASLVASCVDVASGLVAVLPLLGLPLVQVLAGRATPAQAADAGLALLGPLAAWLVLRPLARGAVGTMLAAVLVASAFAQAVFGLAQSVLRPQSVYGRGSEFVTTPFASFVNHNHFAAFAALGALLAVGLCVRRIRQDGELTGRALLWAGASGVIVLAHLASRSRGGFIALAAGLTVLALLLSRRSRARRRALLFGILPLALVGAVALAPEAARDRLATLLASADGARSFRIDISFASLRLAAAHPLLGSGLGTFADAVTRYKLGHGEVRAAHAENDAAQFLAEAGLAGLVALAWAAWWLLPALRRTVRSSALGTSALAAVASLAVHSLFDFNLRVPSTALAAAVCLALACADRSPGEPRPDSRGWSARAAAAVVLAGLAVFAGLACVASLRRQAALRIAEPVARQAALAGVLRLNPLDAESRRDRARADVQSASGAWKEARLARAAAEYRRVLEQRPQWAEAWYELAWVEAARGEATAAREAVDRAAGLDPTNAALQHARAALLAQLGSVPKQ